MKYERMMLRMTGTLSFDTSNSTTLIYTITYRILIQIYKIRKGGDGIARAERIDLKLALLPHLCKFLDAVNAVCSELRGPLASGNLLAAFGRKDIPTNAIACAHFGLSNEFKP